MTRPDLSLRFPKVEARKVGDRQRLLMEVPSCESRVRRLLCALSLDCVFIKKQKKNKKKKIQGQPPQMWAGRRVGPFVRHSFLLGRGEGGFPLNSTRKQRALFSESVGAKVWANQPRKGSCVMCELGSQGPPCLDNMCILRCLVPQLSSPELVSEL